LRFDSLEERALLSISPLDLDSVLVNQTFGAEQVTNTAHSVATDSNGDFAVAWTRFTPVLDSNGNPAIPSQTVGNVYARYFTDEVQRVSLPGPGSVNTAGQLLADGIATNFDDDTRTVGHFSLAFMGDTQVQISVTAGTYPSGDPNNPSVVATGSNVNPAGTVSTDMQNVKGVFTLWFDANGNGVVNPGETFTVAYDESTPAAVAQQIQGWLRSFVPVAGVSNATQATVSPVDPQDYLVDFGPQTQVLDMSNRLQFLGPNNPQGAPANFSLSGFEPSVTVTTLDRPFVVSNIPVSQDPVNGPNLTALAITNFFQQAVDQAWAVRGVAPIEMPPPASPGVPGRVGDSEAPYQSPIANSKYASHPAPVTQDQFAPSVRVTPVTLPDGTQSSTQFDIEFTGTLGCRVEPAMQVTAAFDENAVTIDTTKYTQVQILKESSPEFQVNPPEQNSIYSPNQDSLSNDQPAVAMDAAGDFVVAWRGEVSQQISPKDTSDICARMYSPVGITDSYNGAYVPGEAFAALGVRALPNPTVAQTQQIVFNATGALPVEGSFYLQLGSYQVGPITFDSTDLPQTAINIQTALYNLGPNFDNVTVAYVPPSVQPGNPSKFTFKVTFKGAATGVDEPPISLPSGQTLPVTFSQSFTTPDMYTLDVNSDIANPQFEPVVSMDVQGNFVVAWAGQGQDISYFNGVFMQRYNRYGQVVGANTTVDRETTDVNIMPAIAMGPLDDYVAVSWTLTSDPGIVAGQGFAATVEARAYDPNNNPLWNQFFVGGGGNSSIAMDGQDNYTVTWEAWPGGTIVTGLPDIVDDTGVQSAGVYGREFELIDPATRKPVKSPDPDSTTALQPGPGPAIGSRLIRDIFRVNSGTFNGDPDGIPYPDDQDPDDPTFVPATWAFDQFNSAVTQDQDGDIAVSYEGAGPNVSSNVSIPATFFQPYFSTVAGGLNNDLLKYFNPYPHSGLQGDALPVQAVNSGAVSTFDTADAPAVLYQGDATSAGATIAEDVDTAIDQVLFNAEKPAVGSGLAAASPEQLGRLRGILEGVAGMLRGDSAGTMVSQLDASPLPAVQSFTYSDSVANSTRDGTDQRFYIEIPGDVEGGPDPLGDVSTFSIELYVGENTQGQPLQNSLNPLLSSTQVARPNGDLNEPFNTVITLQIKGNPYGLFDQQQLALDIEAAIDQALGGANGGTGNWPQSPTNPFGGDCTVRLVPGPNDIGPQPSGETGFYPASTPDEILQRQNTDWQIPGINIANYHQDQTHFVGGLANHGNTLYEVTFHGEMANIPVNLRILNYNVFSWFPYVIVVGQNQVTTDELKYPAHPPVAISGDYAGYQGTDQYNSSIAETSEGDMTLAYTQQQLYSNGAVPQDAYGNAVYQNVYYRRLGESTNTSGPQVTDWSDGTGKSFLDVPGNIVAGETASYFVLTFDQPLLSGDPNVNPDSALDPNNYKIYDSNGNLLSGVITHVDYGLSEVAQLAGQPAYQGHNLNPIPSNKYEVVLTLNGSQNSAQQGVQPLSDGTYTLVVDNAVPVSATTAGQSGIRNIFGTPLNLSGFNPTGKNWTYTITIHASTNVATPPGPPGRNVRDVPINTGVDTGNQIDPRVASSLNGNYVVVWTSYVNANTTQIMGELFNPNGQAQGSPFVVNQQPVSGLMGTPDVAMDNVGDFVIVWSGQGPDYNVPLNTSDVFMRVYAPNGDALGGQTTVNVAEGGAQNQATVAMNHSNGNFVVAWTGHGQYNATNPVLGVYYREYTDLGVPLPGFIQEKLLSNAANSRYLPDVAMDDNGDIAVVYEGGLTSGSSGGMYGMYFNNNTGAWSGEFTLDTIPVMNQQSGTGLGTNAPPGLSLTGPRVSMDDTGAGMGSFVVTWSNYVTSSPNGYSIYARRFSAGGAPRDASEFIVNLPASYYQTNSGFAPGWQLMPDVSVADDGEFTIVWTSFGQDNEELQNLGVLPDYGIYCRMYNDNGTTNVPVFRVNATTIGSQVAPTVDRKQIFFDRKSNSNIYNSIVIWVGPNGPFTGLFDRLIDPPPVVTAVPKLTIGDITVNEGGAGKPNATAVFTVTLSAKSSTAVTVAYATADGTATTAKKNYTPRSGTLTIAAGQLTNTISVSVANDTLPGAPNKAFSLKLSNPAHATLAKAAATCIVVDALPAPGITISDTTVQEGGAGKTNATAFFTVTLSTASQQAVHVSYATANGTAIAGKNYLAASGILAFAAGSTKQTISVSVLNDTLPAPSRTFYVNLTSPAGGTLARAKATATVFDVLSPPSITISDASVQEGGAGKPNATATFNVTLSAAYKQSVTVHYSTFNGTATAGKNYNAASGVLTFSPGVITKPISVSVDNDTAPGANKTFYVILTNPINATLARSKATGTIIDVLTAKTKTTTTSTTTTLATMGTMAVVKTPASTAAADAALTAASYSNTAAKTAVAGLLGGLGAAKTAGTSTSAAVDAVLATL
jgi:hypothetical protein